MRAKVFGSIETLSREISAPMRLVPLGEGDFSTLWRLCIESPSQPKLASSLHNKRLSYWRMTGFGRNDNEAGGVFASICSLQTYDKASAAKLSNYPVRNQSFFHSPCFPPNRYLLTDVSKALRTEILRLRLRMTSSAGRYSRNADFILIAAGDTTTLSRSAAVKLKNPPATGPVNLKNLFHNPMEEYKKF